jgi:hypothetical protein
VVDEPRAPTTRRGGAESSGRTQFAVRSEQESGMLVRSVESAARATVEAYPATAAAIARMNDRVVVFMVGLRQ